MENNLTFDNLPNAISELSKKVENIERLLLLKKEEQITELSEQLLTIQEAASFLNLSVPTVYSKVSKGELPFMKRSKRLYFSSFELMDYLKKGRNKTNSEIELDADVYLNRARK
ncbi:DNA-binding protein [Flavobacterium amnicola]|uniref:DNA-binding protein n=1 Tax=Flavobacterium amnicola TaxID=2506422 RepID=A0A4Q1K045_9FLAO|nr:helix-turn-helix domain-containing protein [Flavobacterium amnicola]RXR16313.1 DNA-binding protein [Flavobacterium amnicola]